MQEIKVRKIGNSLGVLLPKDNSVTELIKIKGTSFNSRSKISQSRSCDSAMERIN